MSEARLGWQMGVATWKSSKRQPCAASASMCGVRTSVLP